MSVFATEADIRPMPRWQRAVLACAVCTAVALAAGFALGRGSVQEEAPAAVPFVMVAPVPLQRQLPMPPMMDLMPLAQDDASPGTGGKTVAEREGQQPTFLPPTKAIFQ